MHESWYGLLVAALISLLAVGGCSSNHESRDCTFVLSYDGHRYMIPPGEQLRPTPVGEQLGEGKTIGCDAGAGSTGDTSVEVRAFPGVPPERAVVVSDTVLVSNPKNIPGPVVVLKSPMPCDMPGRFTVAGTFADFAESTDGPPDGPPYTLRIRALGEPPAYRGATLAVEVSEKTKTSLTAKDLGALTKESSFAAKVHCQGEEFSADELALAE